MILVAGALLVSCKWNGDFTITGEVDGFGVFDSVSIETIDGSYFSSSVSDKGSFELKGNVTEPTNAILFVDGDTPIMSLFIDGSSIKISGNIDEGILIASGTPANNAYNAYSKIEDELSERYDDAQSDEERQDIEQNIDDLQIKTIDENNNLFGLAMIATSATLTGKEMIAKLDLFSVELQNTAVGKKVRELAEIKMKVDVGSSYIEIVLPDKDGNEIKLSDYVGKGYVLVDFWASWCGYCLQELPYLKDSYAKYHERGFEIFGVSIDRDKDAWIKAIENNQMTWVHTGTVMNPATSVTEDYSVSGVPSNFLIDKEGKIVAKNLRGKQLAEKLNQLLGE